MIKAPIFRFGAPMILSVAISRVFSMVIVKMISAMITVETDKQDDSEEHDLLAGPFDHVPSQHIFLLRRRHRAVVVPAFYALGHVIRFGPWLKPQ